MWNDHRDGKKVTRIVISGPAPASSKESETARIWAGMLGIG
jgi:hypothetical protein